MPVPLDFLKDPWADTGDRVQFPYNPDTITELMSWLKGFTAKYQRIPEEGGVYIERREFNQILYLLTKQVIDAFKITASDAQLDAEIAARTEKDNSLQHQLDTKFMNIESMGSFTHGVNYYVDEPCFLIARFGIKPPDSVRAVFLNAEIIRNNDSIHRDVGQFVFATPWGHRPDINALEITNPSGGAALTPTSQLPYSGTDGANITVTTFLNAGDFWHSKAGSGLGRDNSSGVKGLEYFYIK